MRIDSLSVNGKFRKLSQSIMQLIVGSYYCSRTDNQQPTCHYPTSHYPSRTMGYCNNLLFSRFPGRCQFFLEGFSASQKHSFSSIICLFHIIVHKYMINTELYFTFSKYVDKLLLEKNLDKSANIPMNSHTNQQSFQLFLAYFLVLFIYLFIFNFLIFRKISIILSRSFLQIFVIGWAIIFCFSFFIFHFSIFFFFSIIFFKKSIYFFIV